MLKKFLKKIRFFLKPSADIQKDKIHIIYAEMVGTEMRMISERWIDLK